jgi:hypothetical protein
MVTRYATTAAGCWRDSSSPLTFAAMIVAVIGLALAAVMVAP